MGRQPQTRFARCIKRPAKVFGFACLFVTGQAKSDDPVASGFSRADRRFPRLVGAEMTNGRDNAAQDDPRVFLGNIGGLADRVEVFAPGPQVAAPAEIGREEGLAVDDARGGTFLQHRKGQAMVIVGALQGFGRRLIDLEEVPEIAEGISAVCIEYAFNIHVFCFGQSADESRRGCPFQMQMQLDLGHACTHRKLLPGPCEATPRCAATEAAISTKAT